MSGNVVLCANGVPCLAIVVVIYLLIHGPIYNYLVFIIVVFVVFVVVFSAVFSCVYLVGLFTIDSVMTNICSQVISY